MTYFKKNDYVTANVTAQGLEKGLGYTVVDLAERRTFAGNFVRYLVQGANGTTGWVGNLHLLATKVG